MSTVNEGDPVAGSNENKNVPPHLRSSSIIEDKSLTSATNVEVKGRVSIIGDRNVRGRALGKEHVQDLTPDTTQHFSTEIAISNAIDDTTHGLASSSAAGDEKNDTGNTSKDASWVPPHLRGGKSPVPVTTHHYSGELASISEEKDEPESPVVVDDTLSVNTRDQEPGAVTSVENLAGSSSETEIPSDKPAAVAQSSSPSLTATGQAILLILGAIEVTGYLGTQALEILYELRDKIIEQGIGALPNPDSDASDADQGLNVPNSPELSQASEFFQKFPDLVVPATKPTANLRKLRNKPSKYTVEELLKMKPVIVTDPKDLPEGDARDDQIYFASWGSQEKRDTPTARVRTVKITNLPTHATPSFVTSLIFGGPIEFIAVNTTDSASGTLAASVRFFKADDCIAYYDKTANGVVYKKDEQGREMVCFVKLAKEVDVVGGLLNNWIEHGVTRCVRAVGVEKDLSSEALKKMGESKGRKLEGISDIINPAGHRSVVWRFCKVEDAVSFKAALSRDEDWDHCNIHHADDPCASAKDVHFDD